METKIAFFHEYFPKGGAERVTLDLCEYLLTVGYEIYLFTREYYEEKLPVYSFFRKNIKVLLLPDSNDSDSKVNAEFIANKTREFNINILVIQAYVLQSIKIIKKNNNNIKIVYCNHGMPFWEIRDKIERKKEKANTSIFNKLKYYLIDIHKIYTFKSYDRRFKKAYLKLYNEVDAYVTLCENYSKEIAETLNLENTKKLYAINNAEKTVDNIVVDKKNVVLFVGRLSYADKRVDRLLNIWNLIKDKTENWKLFIIGDGPEKSNLEKMAKDLKLENVEFKGFRKNTREFYDQASILCMTSTFEGWGLVLTEAQANGVIPIAFDCSEGVKSILGPDGINGIIIPSFDINKYAKSLENLICDIDYRKKIQNNVIIKAKSYSLENICRQWIDLFNKI